jgi:hypothetical protein
MGTNKIPKQVMENKMLGKGKLEAKENTHRLGSSN